MTPTTTPSTVRPPEAATDRGETTRRHILEVAANAFARGGYAGTSLNDVIRDAGVTKGGFYFHFPSKETLALETLRYKQQQWAARVLASAMRHPRAIDQLRAIPQALCDLHEADMSAKAIGRLCMELSEDRALTPDLTGMWTMWMDLTASLVRSAQAEGSVRPDVDPHVVAEVAVTAFYGMESMSWMMAEGADLRQRVERFSDFLMQLLLTDRERSVEPPHPQE